MYNDYNLIEVTNSEDIITSDKVIYTKWEIKTYTISVYVDGNKIDEVLLTYGSKYDTITKPTKENYKFKGWYTDSQYKTLLTSSATVKANINIYGKQELNTYKVSYYDGNNMIKSFTVNYGVLLGSVNKPVKEGYTIQNIYFDIDKLLIINNDYIITNNLNLYLDLSINTYNILIISDETKQDNYELVYGTNLSSIDKPLKQDHLFIGYYQDSSFSIKVEDTLNIKSNLTLYVKWLDLRNISYKVIYLYSNNLTGEKEIFNEINLTGYYNTQVYPEINKYPGYQALDENISDYIKLDGSTVIEVLYEKNNYQVKYVIGEYLYKVDTLPYKSSYQVINDNIIDGYIFDNWFNDSLFKVQADLSIIPANDVYIYGKAEKIIEGTEGLEYTLNNDNLSYSVTGYNGSNRELIIPNGYNHLPVVKIEKLDNLINVKKITINENVKIISENAFKNAINLETIILPVSIEEINDYAFYNCQNLIEIEIGIKINKISDLAYINCYKLEKIIVEVGNLKYNTIDNVLFDKSTGTLQLYPSSKKDIEYILPVNTLIIGRLAIQNNDYLKFLDLNDELKEIRIDSIGNCNNLEEITISKNVEIISETNFKDCPLMKAYIVDDNNLNYTSIEGILFSKDLTTLIKYPCSKEFTIFEIPKEVEIIKYKAFEACNYLNKVIIGSNVLCLEYHAFINSINLEVYIVKKYPHYHHDAISNCLKVSYKEEYEVE